MRLDLRRALFEVFDEVKAEAERQIEAVCSEDGLRAEVQRLVRDEVMRQVRSHVSGMVHDALEAGPPEWQQMHEEACGWIETALHEHRNDLRELIRQELETQLRDRRRR